MWRLLLLAFILSVLWLWMSDHYTLLIIKLGIASVAFVVFMAYRLGSTDNEGLPLHLMARLPRYWLWLIKEIIVSNIQTAKVILSNNPSPEYFWVTANVETAAGLVTYANSITLTPGTVVVDIKDDTLLVHSLTSSFGDDVRKGDMHRRVIRVEGT